jgi:peptidoglycan/xylan/chitin deacetylase (PgdA/CDA1 family)
MRLAAEVRSHLRRSAARAAALVSMRPTPGLRILTYHRVNDHHPTDRLTVSVAAFRAQMERLVAEGRPVVPLRRMLPGLRGEAPVPEGAVAITFDDGYADNFTDALPILDRLRLPATFFVATGLMGTADTLDRYRGCCRQDGMLGWSQVRALRERGHEIGGHGRRHLELAGLSREEALAEIAGCAADVERETGERPVLFCYPRGSESPVVRELTAAAGYLAACTVYPGANPAPAPLFALRRTEVSGSDRPVDFRLKLTGGFDAWHRLVQGRRGLHP